MWQKVEVVSSDCSVSSRIQGKTMKGNDTNKPPNDKKNGKPAIKSSRIDHTYYDHSTRPLSEFIDVDEKRSKRISFPMKLHAILSKVEYRHIICWMPHGRSWKVVDKDLLVSIVCKENFSHESFGSFNRSVNGEHKAALCALLLIM